VNPPVEWFETCRSDVRRSHDADTTTIRRPRVPINNGLAHRPPIRSRRGRGRGAAVLADQLVFNRFEDGDTEIVVVAPDNDVDAEVFVELPLPFDNVKDRIRFGIEGRWTPSSSLRATKWSVSRPSSTADRTR